MSPLLLHARVIIDLVHARADEWRREGRNEVGASAVEWAIISAVVVLLALGVAAAIRAVVADNIGKIGGGSN